MFQMGWNHQLVMVNWDFTFVSEIPDKSSLTSWFDLYIIPLNFIHTLFCLCERTHRCTSSVVVMIFPMYRMLYVGGLGFIGALCWWFTILGVLNENSPEEPPSNYWITFDMFVTCCILISPITLPGNETSTCWFLSLRSRKNLCPSGFPNPPSRYDQVKQRLRVSGWGDFLGPWVVERH